MASDGTIKISTDLDIKAAKQAMSQFSGESQKGLSGIKTAASVMSAAVVAAAAAATSAVIQLGSEFKAQMSTVQAISGATASELDSLKKHAEYMGATTQFTAKQSGEAMEYMAMAGWKTNDMLSGLEGIMYAAGASGEDLAMVSDIVTDGLTAFGLSAKESGRFADVLAAASSNSNTNIGMMGETFKYVGSVAGAFGYTIEDTSVAIGLMANSGIKASQAGTSLRQILLGLQGGAELTGSAFGTTRIEVENTDGTMRDLNDVMVDLRSAFGQMTEAEKAQNAELISGKIGMSGLLSIVNASEGDFNKLTTAIENSTGVAKKMNEVSLDNLQGDVTILDSTIEGLGIQVYNSFDEPFRIAAQGATKSINGISKELAKPGMKKSLDNIGNGMADLVVSATKLATKTIPPLISIIDCAIKSFDVLAPAVIMTTTAMGTIKGVNAFTKALDTAQNTLTLVGKSTELMTVTIGKKAAAEAMATAATKANMTVNASGQLVTSAGTIATAAETTAIVANTGAISLKTLALGVMTGQIGFVTAAQVIWNAAMTANPIGLIIVGVSTLIAGVLKLTKVLGEESDAGKKTQETVEGLQKEHDKLKQSIDDSKASYDDSASAIDANAKKAEKLIKKIKDMSAVTEKNAGQTKLLKGWITDLNTIMPELSISYNEQTGEVEGLNDSTENRIRLIKEEAKTEAKRKYLTELYEQQAEAEIRLQIAQEELTLATKEHGEEAYKTWSNATEFQKKYMWSMLEMDAVFGPLSDHHAVLESDLNGINSEISIFEQNISNASNTAVNAAITALEQVSGAFGGTKIAITEYTEEQINALDGLQDEYQIMADSALNMFDKISNESKISLDEIIANLKYNQDVTEQWAENMAKLTEAGINQGLLETLRQAGPESAVLVADLVKSMEIGDDKWQEISNLYAKGAAETVTSFATAYGINDIVANEVANMVNAASTSLTTSIQAAGFGITGTNTVNEFAQGIKNGAVGVALAANAIVNTVSSITTGTKLEFDKSTVNLDAYTKSMSGLMDNLTTNLTEDQAAQLCAWLGMVADAEMHGKEISAETQTMVDTVISSLDEMPARTRNAMKNAMAPMLEEMENSAPVLFAKAAAIANGVLASLRKALDINSPSRKTRKIFQQVMQGSELGLADEEKSLYGQIDDIGSNIIDKFNEIDVSAWMQKINDASLMMQMDYSTQVQMANAMAKVSLQTGNAVEDSVIDYDKMGNAVKKALNDVKVDIDGKVAGTIISPYVDRNLGHAERIKWRT